MAALLVKVSGDGKAFSAQATQGLAAGKVDVTPILSVPAPGAGPGVAAAKESTWLRVASRAQAENPWDEAHALLAAGAAFAAAGGSAIEAVEPDRAQQWIWRPPRADGGGGRRRLRLRRSGRGRRQGQGTGAGVEFYRRF